jgi:hypothetical protein
MKGSAQSARWSAIASQRLVQGACRRINKDNVKGLKLAYAAAERRICRRDGNAGATGGTCR